MATKEVNLGSVRGPQGAAATVTVGKVTTGEAGTSAAVTNSGTSGAAILNFTIPRGAQGNPTAVNGKSGASITLTAQDVGARPSSWTPSAKDVGALPAGGWRYDGTEVDSGKRWIDGKTIYRKTYVVNNAAFPNDAYKSYVTNVFTDPNAVAWLYVDVQRVTENSITGGVVSITGSSFIPQYTKSRNSLDLLRLTPTDAQPSAPSGTATMIFTIEYYYKN